MSESGDRKGSGSRAEGADLRRGYQRTGCDHPEADHGTSGRTEGYTWAVVYFICHNLALVQSFCDKVLVLYDGKVVESGKPDNIINAPQEAYTKKLVDAVLSNK